VGGSPTWGARSHLGTRPLALLEWDGRESTPVEIVALSHEQLWAPWRLGYIKGESAELLPAAKLDWLAGADHGCFICRAAAERRDRLNLVVQRTERSITLLNRYPYNNGHLLVAPLNHQGRLDELAADVHQDLMWTSGQLVTLLERLLNAEGFNIGLNLGRVAGAGLPGHLHWHIVPRWNGDTNFMPALAGVKVIPQSLDALWELLSGELSKNQ
jgi:ATP adenylyltransferase